MESTPTPTLPGAANPSRLTVTFDDQITRYFVIATAIWGFVGMLVGALIALQLPFWQANLGEYLSFGRLRPLHTNAVIFAFAGNAIFAAIYYSTQRLLKTRMFSDGMSRFHFWGWQAIIDRLTVVRGIGPWSVQMYLMFRLGRPDVLPHTDLGIRKGMQKLDSLDELPAPAAVLARGDAWRPYRTLASWYLWRGLELPDDLLLS